MDRLSKEWFELQDVRKRLFAKQAWIPVYGFKEFPKIGNYPEVGYVSEMLGIGAAVIFEGNREDAEKLGWSQYSQDPSSAHLFSDGRYLPVDSFAGYSEEQIGFRLVLSQSSNSNHLQNVQIHQDFVYAYELIEEGNKWLKPNAGYEEVIRAERDENNVITYVEIRSEYLRDYLAARGAALRLYYFRQREAVLNDDPKFDWPDDYSILAEEHNRCEVRCFQIDQTGDRPGSTWALFTARRTDVDIEEDIPDFSDETDENTTSESHEGIRKTEEIRYRLMGELWRGEWIEPLEKSERLGYNDPEENLYVSIDASGKKENLENLNEETVGKYLWFDASLVESLLACRGSSLEWYSKETGALSGRPDGYVHFGVNQLGHLNAYAYDVARLPLWERKLWVSKNIRPDGGVSAELQRTQMECRPADTKSCEYLIKFSVQWLRECCLKKYNLDIFREHAEITNIEKRLHRFRASDENGLRSLAKDCVRYTIERLNKKVLLQILELEKSDLGTLKLLERVLSSVTSDEFARSHMAPLYGAYDLRGADAHLSSTDIEGSYSRVMIDRDMPFFIQGEMLLKNIADTIEVIGTQIIKTKKD